MSASEIVTGLVRHALAEMREKIDEQERRLADLVERAAHVQAGLALLRDHEAAFLAELAQRHASEVQS